MLLAEFGDGKPRREGALWLLKCACLGVLIAAGWAIGKLQAFAVGAIVLFGVIQGVLPFRRVASQYVADASKCRSEKRVLQGMTIEQAVLIKEVHDPNAGTLFRLVKFIIVHEERLGKTDAADLFLAIERIRWNKRLESLLNSVDQSTSLGMFGTIIGLGLGMEELANNDAGPQGMATAIGTALHTTLAGCVTAFVLGGLRSVAERTVDRHLAEVELVASLLLGRRPPKPADGDDLERLV